MPVARRDEAKYLHQDLDRYTGGGVGHRDITDHIAAWMLLFAPESSCRNSQVRILRSRGLSYGKLKCMRAIDADLLGVSNMLKQNATRIVSSMSRSCLCHRAVVLATVGCVAQNIEDNATWQVALFPTR